VTKHGSPRSFRRSTSTAPVSHQKRSHQKAMNTINPLRKSGKINDPVLCPPAHNGLVAGSSPGGPADEISSLLSLVRDHRTRNAPLPLRLPSLCNSQTNPACRTRLGPPPFDRRFGGLIARNGWTRSHPFLADRSIDSRRKPRRVRFAPKAAFENSGTVNLNTKRLVSLF
jgi:hypothetical protein